MDSHTSRAQGAEGVAGNGVGYGAGQPGGPAWWLALLGLFVLAVAVRALPLRNVFVEGSIHFFGGDAYYHLRRIVYSVAHFPDVLDFDRYINFPHGARPIWTPVFDGLAALLLWPFRNLLSQYQMEVVAAWIPPVLGALTVLALARLGRRHFSPAVGLLAAAILSVLSAHVWFSQIGFVDHHVAVALVTTWLLSSAMSFLARSSSPASASDIGWGPAVWLGVALGGCLLLWPGCLLHVGLVESGLLIWLLTRVDRSASVAAARSLAVVHASAFVLTCPAFMQSDWEQWGAFSPVVLSSFQPWFFGSATLFCVMCAELWARVGPAGTSASRRVAISLASGLVVTGLGVALWPGILEAASDAWNWFAKTDQFQGLVAESRPLFLVRGGFGAQIALIRLSGFFFLVPFALLIAAAVARRRRDGGALFLFLWWTLGLCGVTLFQKRFFNSSSVAVALLFGLSVVAAYRFSQTRGWTTEPRRWMARVILGVTTVGLLAPSLAVHQHLVKELLAPPERGGRMLTGMVVRKFAQLDAARWLRANTPPTAGWLDSEQEPEYGVLAPWTMGHIIEYVGRRPTVNNNFGDDIGEENFQKVQEFFQGNEVRAARIATSLRARYVIVQIPTGFLSKPPGPGSMYHRLFTHDGSEAPPTVPALRHHRLVYESPVLTHTEGARSFLKVYEFVAGARIVGRAAPHAEVRAIVPVKTNLDRRFVHATRTRANAEGVYEIRVPYANFGGPPSVWIAKRYTLECRGDRARVAVDESAVAGGRAVKAPPLCSAESPLAAEESGAS